MRRIVYFPKPLENDSIQGEEGKQNNRGSNSDTEIIEPPEYQTDEQLQSQERNKQSTRNDLLKRFFPDILKAIGDKAIKETPPTLQELEAYLQQHISNLNKTRSSNSKDRNWRDMTNTNFDM